MHQSPLKNFKPRHGSPPSRQEIRDREEAKECTFSPGLDPRTQEIATFLRQKKPQADIREYLYEEYNERVSRKMQAEYFVTQINYFLIGN